MRETRQNNLLMSCVRGHSHLEWVKGPLEGTCLQMNQSIILFWLRDLSKLPLNADSTPPCIIWNPEHAHHQEDHLVY